MLRVIRRSSRFKKDYKKAKKQHKDISLLEDVICKLAKGEPLSPKFKDHPLTGNVRGYRELHCTRLAFDLPGYITRIVVSQDGIAFRIILNKLLFFRHFLNRDTNRFLQSCTFCFRGRFFRRAQAAICR
jgi:addiction module RelE/StbE family toxin